MSEISGAAQDEICKAIAVACMWGQGGIAGVIIDQLSTSGPKGPRGWYETYHAVAATAKRESVGVIAEQSELDRWLGRGYWLCNFDDDGCALFNPPPMNGLAKYVSKELADAYQKKREAHDAIAREIWAAQSLPTLAQPRDADPNNPLR